MKKAIRLTAYLAVLSLAFSMFAACSNGSNNEDTTLTTSESVFSTESTTESTTVTTQTEATTSSTTVTKEETDSIETILSLIANYPQGTAGSASKCVDISIRFINFTENTTQTTAEIKKDVNSYISSLSSDKKALFDQNFYEIDYTCKRLISGDASSYQSYIDQSTEKYDKGNYTLSKYDAVNKLITTK